MGNIIQLEHLTPEVYYKQSRDFQFLGRLYDVVLNHVKTNTELLPALELTERADTNLLELLLFTLGFKAKHEYNAKQLAGICQVLPTLLRNKGSLYAVQIALNSILQSEGINEITEISFDKNNYTLFVTLPVGLADINLFLDLLNYILPAGISCSVSRENMVTYPAETDIVFTDSVKSYTYDTSQNSYSEVVRQTNDYATAEYTVYKESLPVPKPGLFIHSLIKRQTATSSTTTTPEEGEQE